MNIDDIEEVYQPFSRQSTGKATPRVFALYIIYFVLRLVFALTLFRLDLAGTPVFSSAPLVSC